MLAGQIGWAPIMKSVNGVIVFDGSLVPQIGIVSQPVKVYVEEGEIKKVEGGREATQWEAWLRSFNHPQMLRVAHVCYGFHPWAKLTGSWVRMSVYGAALSGDLVLLIATVFLQMEFLLLHTPTGYP